MSNVTVPFINNNIRKLEMTISASILPSDDSNGFELGSTSKRFSDLNATQTTIGAFFETGLRTTNIGSNPTGTIVSWKEGKLVPSDIEGDELVMGVIKNGKDEPIIFGAEFILITGEIKEGDYIITSKKVGHGVGVKRGFLFKKDLFGKVIAQSLESGTGESFLIKAMIRKM